MAALFLTASPSGNTTQPRSLSLPRSTPICSLSVASLLRNPFPPAAAPCCSSPTPRSFLSPLTRSPSLCGSPAPRSPPPQLPFQRRGASPDAATPDPDPSLLTLLPILFPLSTVKPTPPPDQIPFSLNPFLLSLSSGTRIGQRCSLRPDLNSHTHTSPPSGPIPYTHPLPSWISDHHSHRQSSFSLSHRSPPLLALHPSSATTLQPPPPTRHHSQQPPPTPIRSLRGSSTFNQSEMSFP